MTFAHHSVTLPECGYDPPYSKRVLGLNKQSTHVHVGMFLCHVQAALAFFGDGKKHLAKEDGTCGW